MSLVNITKNGKGLNVEQAVRARYSAASQEQIPALCCPVTYEKQYLEVLPQELIDRDYGCGDPSKYVQSGETVLDLGSGGGKICYIASQIVGPEGRVLGVDMNDDMLALARNFQNEISQRIGWNNVEFFKGKIQDLALDHDRFADHLKSHPVTDTDSWSRAQEFADNLRTNEPMIASDSVDVVLSNCVLNLVDPVARKQLFTEIHRVLKRGGRAVISDIVCDEVVPDHLKNNPELWSGCISGAFVEDEFLKEFERAGFYGVEIVVRQEEPWATVEGIEFRSMTVRAFKGKEGPCLDHHQAVIYRGPWKSVTDDDGHVLRRGVRTAVCEKTFRIYTTEPYADEVIAVPPYHAVDASDAVPYDCRCSAVRHPRETKGVGFDATQLPQTQCCGPDEKCC
ncbi:MAG: methyltransferase domain-containing protein [Planctomycetaceae bacterium]|nr:methyltransferase domain-containing protein [Planctomycetales bacterium]MCB9924705.1 methyltransferase domain-containing protein [Planctomycetaceae bacterium]